MYKIITLCMYMLTTTAYFATMSTLKYCIIICDLAGGLIFLYIRSKIKTRDRLFVKLIRLYYNLQTERRHSNGVSLPI